jgi:phosphoribosylglycinamide formyltransferase-1
MTAQKPLSLVILISGRGSNMVSIVEAIQHDNLPAQVSAVISNRPQAPGLDYAAAQYIPTTTIDHQAYDDRLSFDHALAEEVNKYQPDLVILAGFMRILTPEFVQQFSGKLINIHPSLLPKFTGLNTHQRAIDAGEAEHGASIHYVTEELDGGPVVLQARVTVLPDDTSDTLAKRVLAEEHKLYPEAIRQIATGQITPPK